MSQKNVFPVAFSFFLFVGFCFAQDKTEMRRIDGVRHVLNPEKPWRGTVVLDVEKSLEINPFEQKDVAMRYVLFARDEDGGVILFDPNRAEGYKYDNKGRFLGSLVKKGEGPGEFSPMQMMKAFFVGNQIWVKGGQKLARFDREGRLLQEIKLKNRPSIIVDESHFISRRTTRNSQNELLEIHSLVKFGAESLSDEVVVDIIQASNVTGIQTKDGRGGFAEPWATPGLIVAYARKDKRILAALNTKYEITVKNLKGETEFVIEKSHQKIRVNNKDKKDILGSDLMRFLPLYPDELLAFQDIQALPDGGLVVRRVSGVKKVEVDVFDADGRYLYALRPPEGISFERAVFHGAGFSLIDYKEDYPVYIDYRIRNLPDIFAKK